MILGGAEGSLCVFSYQSGALLKSLAPHSAEVSAIISVGRIGSGLASNLLLTTSWDQRLFIHAGATLSYPT